VSYDIASEANTGKIYCRKFILWPKYWENYSEITSLSWESIKYVKSEIASLPDNPGVYAFVVKPQIAQLYDCNYLLYIGKAKDQSLKVRCSQYLKEPAQKKPRILITQMLKLWMNNLHLYYSAIDPSTININSVEQELLEAFIPPMNSVLPGKLSLITKDIYRS